MMYSMTPHDQMSATFPSYTVCINTCTAKNHLLQVKAAVRHGSHTGAGWDITTFHAPGNCRA
jgi:hypothetical protein